MSFKAMQKRKGFTMMELLVVVVVLAILAAIGMSYLGGAQDDTKITTAKDEMKTIAGAAAAYATIAKDASKKGTTQGQELLKKIDAADAYDNVEHSKLLADGRWNKNGDFQDLQTVWGTPYSINYEKREVSCTPAGAPGTPELKQSF